MDIPMNMSTEDKIYSIPPDIRPKMTNHRLEVIFWGVRDMRKINYMPVHRPRIIVECTGIHVKSTVIEDAKKFSNFHEPHVMIELVILKQSRSVGLFDFTARKKYKTAVLRKTRK